MSLGLRLNLMGRSRLGLAGVVLPDDGYLQYLFSGQDGDIYQSDVDGLYYAKDWAGDQTRTIHLGSYGQLDGTTNYIVVPANSQTNDIFDTGQTLRILCDYGTIGSQERILGTAGWNLSKDTDGSLRFFNIFSTTSGTWSTTETFSANDILDISLTYDNTSVTNDPVIVVNGTTLTISETTTPVGTRGSDSSAGKYIGSTTGGTVLFDGGIIYVEYGDNVKYPLIEQFGSLVLDASGNANNGTINGTLTNFWQESIEVQSFRNENGYNIDTDGSITGTAGTYISRLETAANIALPIDQQTDVFSTTLTYNGRVNYNAQFLFSACVSMNGTDNYVDAGTYDITGWSSYYWGGWMVTTAATFSVLSFMQHSSNNGFGIYINNSGSIYAQVTDGTNSNSTGAISGKNDGNPHYVELIVASGNITLYVDRGTSDEVSATTTGSFIYSTASGAHTIGARNNFFFLDADVYNVKMGQTESNLEMCLPMAERFSDTLYNTCGTQNALINGTLTSIWGSQDNFHYNLLNGFDLWTHSSSGVLYVPFDENGNSILTDGDTITNYTWTSRNPSDQRCHNGAETYIIQPNAPEIYEAAKLMEDAGWTNVMFSGTTASAIPFSSIHRYDYAPDNFQWFNYWNSDTPTKKNKWSLYPSALTDTTLLNKLIILNGAESLEVTGGNLATSNSNTYVLKEQ